jgi:imidazole glycerol phosphate synthase subunit HisF
MEAMKKVVLCANNTRGTRTINCLDANQTLILQIVAFRQPTEYESQIDMLKPYTQPEISPLSTLNLKNRFQKDSVNITVTTITLGEGLTKSNASLCFQHL